MLMYGVKITGLGKAVPSHKVTNHELSQLVDTSDDWIRSRTGIEARHISQDETTTSLAIRAGQEAVEESGLDPLEIDLVIVATITADYSTPSTACMVASEIGAINATAFDLSAACSGFLYASEVAVNMIRTGAYQNALIIGAEVLSKILDWQDRSTCILFGDGAGAAVYSRTEKNHIIDILTGSDGTGAKAITLPNLASDRTFYHKEEEPRYLKMQGREVYAFATTKVPQNISELLQRVNMEAGDIDYYILHQANSRIMDSVAKKLDIDPERFVKNLETHGNTSGASIPMALYDVKDQLREGDKIVLSGFGAGLTWGSMMVVW